MKFCIVLAYTTVYFGVSGVRHLGNPFPKRGNIIYPLCQNLKMQLSAVSLFLSPYPVKKPFCFFNIFRPLALDIDPNPLKSLPKADPVLVSDIAPQRFFA